MTRTAAPRSLKARAAKPNRKERLAEMVRVDHAGEMGAVRIYEGQLAVFRNAPGMAHMVEALEEMKEDELRHRAAFDEEILKRGVRPTALEPFWRLAGWGLGAATALMGEKAAHACTSAVEEAIGEHYAAQVEELGEDEPELSSMIAQFRDEELAHKDHADAEGAQETPGWPILSRIIGLGCRIAIKVSEKV